MAFAQVNMSAVANITYPEGLSAIWGYTAPDGTEYALVGTRTRVSIVSLANPAAPVEVASVSGPTTSWRELKSWGQHAYVGLDNVNVGLLIIDLSNLPNSVSHIYWTPTLNIQGNNYNLLRVHTVSMSEDGLLILNGTNILSGRPLLFDVTTTPNAPVLQGTVGTVYVHDSYARGDTLWTGDIYNGRFSAWDISNRAAPVLLGQHNTPSNFTHNVWPNDEGTHVFTTDEVSNAYVTAYDITDMGNIEEVDRFRTRETAQGHIPHNVHVRNNYVVTAYYTEGLRILDGHRPHNLIEVGWYDTYPGANTGFYGDWGLYPDFASGLIVVSDMNTGLWVLDPTYVRACYLEGNITDAFSCQPIIGAQVRLLTTPNGVSTANSFGNYATGYHTAGTYNVVVSYPGYVTDTLQATISNGQVTILNVALVPVGCGSAAGIIFVNDDATGNGTGNCWTNAYTNLQAAIVAAQPGQQIWVAQGTYRPTTGNNRNLSFTLKANVSIYGGFPDNGACTVQQRNWQLYPTRLSGNIGNQNVNTDNSYRVVTAVNTGANAVLDGFYISDAYSNGNGGGILVQASGNGVQSSPLLQNLQIENNYTSTKGGGAFLYAYTNGTVSPTFTDVNFVNNVAAFDGGGFCSLSQSGGNLQGNFNGCVFTGNTTPQKGGAFVNWTNAGGIHGINFNSCTFENNTSTGTGGGGFNYARGGATLVFNANNCEFTNNTGGSGGALYLYASGGNINANIAQCIFTDNNSPASNGGALSFLSEFAGGNNTATVSSCLFSGQTGSQGAAVANAATRGGVGNVQFSRSRFEDNFAALNGGAAYLYALNASSSAVTNFTNCIFFENNANKSGGIFYANANTSGSATTTLTNCTLYGNYAGTGGAIYNIASTAPSGISLVNCIVRNNPATDPNSRTFQNVGGQATLNLSYTLLDAVPCAQVVAGSGVLVCGNGNLAAQPGFVNAANGDLHITNASPAKDAGTAQGAPGVDFDGTARPQGAGFDMGAYEVIGIAPPERLAAKPIENGLKLYPNPTEGALTLQFEVPTSGLVQLFGADGRLYKQVSITVATTQFGIDLGGLPSGAYLVRVSNGTDSWTQRANVVRP